MRPRRPPGLSVVLPAWNEEGGIRSTVEEIRRVLDALTAEGRLSSAEIIVVDDGSTDGTEAVVTALAAGRRDLRLVAHGTNRGLGAAIRTGLAEARGDVVLYTDADLPADAAHIGDALDLLGDAPTLVCARRQNRRGDGPRRFVYSVVYNALVRLVLRVRVDDVNFAFKLLPTEPTRALGLRSEGSFIDAELVARAHACGIPVRQFTVSYRARASGRSSLSSWSVIRHLLREMRVLTPGIRRQRPDVADQESSCASR